MRIDWDVPLTMDDGNVLRADIFRPVADGKYPVIMTYGDRKSTRLNSSHSQQSRMPSSA